MRDVDLLPWNLSVNAQFPVREDAPPTGVGMPINSLLRRLVKLDVRAVRPHGVARAVTRGRHLRAMKDRTDVRVNNNAAEKANTKTDQRDG